MKSPNLSPIASNDVSSIASGKSSVGSLKSMVSKNSLFENQTPKKTNGIFIESWNDDVSPISSKASSNKNLADGLEKPVGNQAAPNSNVLQTTNSSYAAYPNTPEGYSDVRVQTFEVSSQMSSDYALSEKKASLASTFTSYLTSLLQSTQTGLKKLGSFFAIVPKSLSKLSMPSTDKELWAYTLVTLKNQTLAAVGKLAKSSAAAAAAGYAKLVAFGALIGSLVKSGSASIVQGLKKTSSGFKSVLQKVKAGSQTAYQKTLSAVQNLVTKFKQGASLEGFGFGTNKSQLPDGPAPKVKVD